MGARERWWGPMDGRGRLAGGRGGRRGGAAALRARRGPLPPPAAALAGAPLLAALAGCSAAGDALARRSAVGCALSAPVATMLCGAALANACTALGGASVDLTELRAVQGVLVAVATPLLLMGANLREIVRGAGPLLPGFAVGSLGTLAGAFIGVSLLGDGLADALGALAGAAGGEPGAGLAPHVEVAGVSAALAAKNIGGGFNFVAVAESAGVSSPAVALALAADNIAALVYFPLNSYLAGPSLDEEQEGSEFQGGPRIADYSSAEELTLALAVSLAIVVAVSGSGAGGNTIAVASAATIALATASPRTFEPLRTPGATLARMLLGLFFASAGLAGGRVAGIDPGALIYVGALLLVIYAAHIGAVALAQATLKMTPLNAAIVSNAAVGGPATAAALASAKGADPTPAVLVGNLGNAAATFLALAALPALRAAAGGG